MKKLMKLKLETSLEFQKNYPTSHVGGSIGLFLRGMNLQRDLDKSEKYNVSKLKEILFWKKKYADKGVKKHQDDLVTIKTGLRPLEYKEYNLDNIDDLPF